MNDTQRQGLYFGSVLRATLAQMLRYASCVTQSAWLRSRLTKQFVSFCVSS